MYYIGRSVEITSTARCTSDGGRDLDFSDNQLTGKLPTFLTAFSVLTNLDLSNNKLAGPAPTSLSTWLNTNTAKYVTRNSLS